MAVSLSTDSRNDGAFRETIVVLFFLLVALAALTDRTSRIGELLRENYSNSVGLALSLQILVAGPVILLWERLKPAQPNVPLISPAVAIDAIHTFVVRPVTFVVLGIAAPMLSGFLDDNVSWLVVDTTRSLPTLVALALGVMITDFFAWWTHLVKHKVPLLWRFHVMHHAQEQLNMFTANRVHPIEAVQDLLLKFVPVFILFPSLTSSWGNVAWLAALYSTQLRFQHANIRTNLGPLRYLFVTPQSHRLHHSVLKQDWNSNYASFFAWDRLFGTQHPDVTSYPPTGLNDQTYPDPVSWSIRDLTGSLYGQMVHPFRSDAIRRVEEVDYSPT